MYRNSPPHYSGYPSRDNHSYVLGTYTDIELAINEGRKEVDYRAGKYSFEVQAFYINYIQTEDLHGYWKETDNGGSVYRSKEFIL